MLAATALAPAYIRATGKPHHSVSCSSTPMVVQPNRTARDGTWKPGVRNLGVAEGGVGYAVDQHNRSLITPEMERRLAQARADIIAGKIRVTEYK